MKLKTTIKANDGETAVSITIESTHRNRSLTRYEQEKHHERLVNSAHNLLICGRFNAREIKFTR